MTQPNQSELDELYLQQTLLKLIGVKDGDPRYSDVLLIADYIAANYTPNTKLKALIEASEKINLEFNGRPDCKNCSLQEQLAELTKAKEQQ
ncbi:hypothetical protein EOL96_07250 [Candidatus Saccharibacteria bacterium]|nr:hypothetical protein [Candidatus Saccharibacteria bacterium]